MQMMDGFGPIMMLLVGIVVLGLLLAGLVWLVRALARQDRPPSGDSSAPRAELDLRYARGEIDRDEYLRQRADLEHSQR